MDEDARTSRFSHILQPIRDLSVNWSIDIANELEEYLDELEAITFSFDDGRTNLNFAEAALLIQGASCIYSKKVEFLYTLVYQALDFIEDKKRKESGKSSDKAADPHDDDFFMEDSFLNLDDVVEEATGIDLDENSEKLVTPKTRPPAALIAMSESGTNPNDSERAGFKIASCSIHRSGALLLEAQDGTYLDEDLRPVQEADVSTAMVDTLAAPGAVDPPEQDGHVPLDDDHDFGGAMDDDIQEDYAMAGAADDEEPEEEEVFDPYAPLDPHDAGTLPVNPFRKGKTQMRARKATEKRVYALVPPAATSGVTFEEFGAAFAQRRKEERAVSASERAARRGDPKAVSAFTAGGGAEDDEEDIDYGYDGAAGFEPDDDDDEGLQLTLPAWGAIEDEINAGHRAHNTLELAAIAEGGEGEKSYEDCVREHIARVVAAAAAAEVQTELASRVLSWKKKIEPALEEQDSRPTFDIHSYGQGFITAFSALPNIVPVEDGGGDASVKFEQVVEGVEKYQASRTFAALLQLVNNGNVSVVKGAGGEDNFDFTLVLESSKIKNLNMEIQESLGLGDKGGEAFEAPTKVVEGTKGGRGKGGKARGVLAEAQ